MRILPATSMLRNGSEGNNLPAFEGLVRLVWGSASSCFASRTEKKTGRFARSYLLFHTSNEGRPFYAEPPEGFQTYQNWRDGTRNLNHGFFSFLAGDGAEMDLFDGFSDDQIALFGCLGALVFCATLMLLGSLVRRNGSQSERNRSSEPHLIKMVGSASLPKDDTCEDRQQRRAA